MREQPLAVSAWIRKDLATRYGTVVTEEIPQAMLDVLAGNPR